MLQMPNPFTEFFTMVTTGLTIAFILIAVVAILAFLCQKYKTGIVFAAIFILGMLLNWFLIDYFGVNILNFYIFWEITSVLEVLL